MSNHVSAKLLLLLLTRGGDTATEHQQECQLAHTAFHTASVSGSLSEHALALRRRPSSLSYPKQAGHQDTQAVKTVTDATAAAAAPATTSTTPTWRPFHCGALEAARKLSLLQTAESLEVTHLLLQASCVNRQQQFASEPGTSVYRRPSCKLTHRLQGYRSVGAHQHCRS